MKIGNIFTKFANSKIGKAVYKKLLAPEGKGWRDRYLPVIESGIISSIYVGSTALQKKKMDKDSYTALQLQNLLSFGASVGLSIPMNKGISKLGDNVIEYLDKELIRDAHKVESGIKIGIPIISSLVISRFIVATALVPISSKIRDFVKSAHSKKAEQSKVKLDINV